MRPAAAVHVIGRRLARGLRGVLGLWLCVPLLASASVVPDFAVVRAQTQATEARLVDRTGIPMAERRVVFDARRLEWVPLDALSPAMLEALLEAEDRRFYEHEGIDWRAFAAAAVQNLWFEHARGASTLSMQLAGMLDPALRLGGGRRSLEQKFDQALAAQELEARWSKAQILEAYLNLAPFRGELVGIHAAARALFDVGPEALDRAQAAILAALLRAPNARADKVAWRACELLGRIGDGASCDEARTLAAGLDPVRLKPRWSLAPHLANRLVKSPGQVVHTVLDAGWQQHLLAALAAAAPARAAAVVVDNATGAVLADVGGLAADHADASRVRWPAGPLVRPVEVALVLDTDAVTAATLFDAADGGGVSLRRVLAGGLWPTDLEVRVPGDPLRAQLTDETPPEASLEAVSIDLAQLAAINRMLVTDGQWRAPYWLATEQSGPVPVVSAAAAFIAMDLFAPVRSAPVAAGRSAWAVGSNARVSMAVWMETGASARIEVHAWLQAQLAEAGPWPPERVVPRGVVQAPVRFPGPDEAPRLEWFKRDAITAVAQPPRVVARILAPRDRAILGIEDVDAAGRLRLAATPVDAPLLWRVDGVSVGEGAQAHWRPSPGLHRITLVDALGREIDAREVAVRASVGGR